MGNQVNTLDFVFQKVNVAKGVFQLQGLFIPMCSFTVDPPSAVRFSRSSAGGIGIATKPNSEWSFIYPVDRRRWAKNVAMPGGVGSNPDGVPTRQGTEILRACAVALIPRNGSTGWSHRRDMKDQRGHGYDVAHAWGGGVAPVG